MTSFVCAACGAPATPDPMRGDIDPNYYSIGRCRDKCSRLKAEGKTKTLSSRPVVVMAEELYSRDRIERQHEVVGQEMTAA